MFREDRSEKFKNLESLTFNGLSKELLPFLTPRQLKYVKKLNSLKLYQVELKEIDFEFNYLNEASFNSKIPENIVNFCNLERLCLEYINETSYRLEERFLEDLVNFKELRLDSAFKSIH